MKKPLIIIVLSSVCISVLMIGFLLLDLRRTVERSASFFLNRAVTIDRLIVHWGDPILVDVEGFHLANASWGSEPDIFHFDHMHAAIDAGPLWHGALRFKDLIFDKPELFLERDENGVGNWKFRSHRPPCHTPDPFKHTATGRAGFPTMLNMVMHDGLFRMRTSGGAMLRLDAEEMKISATDDDTPVHVMIDGAFNNAKSRLDLQGGSFRDLRQATKPYPMHLTVVTPRKDKLIFDGTVTDPVDMDGGRGFLDLNIPVVSDIAPMFGIKFKVNLPLQMQGRITRSGDHWLYNYINGEVASAPFTGALKLDEGTRREPDAIGMEIAFEKLDLRPIIDGVSSIGPTRFSDFNRLSLRPDDQPGLLLNMAMTARAVSYRTTAIGDVELKFKTQPSKIILDAFSYSIAGGRATMDGVLDATGKTPHLVATMALSNADITRAVNLAGDHKGELSGPFNARAVLDMRGETVLAGLKNSHGGVVVTMKSGTVARSLLEKAALDVRSIFRRNKGRAAIKCLLGVYDMRNGIGRVLPLRLRTDEADTDLTGGGTVDLITQRVDLTVKSKYSTSGPFALDVPLRFHGSFSSIGVTPVLFGKTDLLDLSTKTQMPFLPPSLQDLVDQSGCL